MKKFTLGFLFFWTISIANNYLYTMTLDSNSSAHVVSWTIKNSLIDGNYLIDPLTDRCSDSKKDSRGITAASYFGCDRFQRYINRSSD